ncbi:hypothetical protein [Mobiluncus mulieris]|uniref:Uncharacterized protein n=1 Tax=Mobiluncus mulieris TaxID=2052 RepID=A0A7Y0UVI8_9ACTO|nr:hypothetical protein [Mobiluncus mulieris]NMX04517.1 hypothetical protein [Mobiluncus mulieris]
MLQICATQATGHVCEYTSPWDPNDGFVRVYREGLLLRYYEKQLDPFRHLHSQPTKTKPELNTAEYPAACSIENTNYAVVVIDKAGPANHNILARPQDGIWQQVADLPNGRLLRSLSFRCYLSHPGSHLPRHQRQAHHRDNPLSRIESTKFPDNRG